MTHTILSEVDPYCVSGGFGSPESEAPRRCDFCGESPYVDLPGQERAFYEVLDEDLTVCEHCLPALFEEDAQR